MLNTKPIVVIFTINNTGMLQRVISLLTRVNKHFDNAGMLRQDAISLVIKPFDLSKTQPT